MAYVLRFVQRFRAEGEAAFMALEAQFAALERRKGWPQGRRSRPFAGREQRRQVGGEEHIFLAGASGADERPADPTAIPEPFRFAYGIAPGLLPLPPGRPHGANLPETMEENRHRDFSAGGAQRFDRFPAGGRQSAVAFRHPRRVQDGRHERAERIAHGQLHPPRLRHRPPMVRRLILESVQQMEHR